MFAPLKNRCTWTFFLGFCEPRLVNWPTFRLFVSIFYTVYNVTMKMWKIRFPCKKLSNFSRPFFIFHQLCWKQLKNRFFDEKKNPSDFHFCSIKKSHRVKSMAFTTCACANFHFSSLFPKRYTLVLIIQNQKQFCFTACHFTDWLNTYVWKYDHIYSLLSLFLLHLYCQKQNVISAYLAPRRLSHVTNFPWISLFILGIRFGFIT